VRPLFSADPIVRRDVFIVWAFRGPARNAATCNLKRIDFRSLRSLTGSFGPNDGTLRQGSLRIQRASGACERHSALLAGPPLGSKLRVIVPSMSSSQALIDRLPPVPRNSETSIRTI
jgi:hypothetical protein